MAAKLDSGSGKDSGSIIRQFRFNKLDTGSETRFWFSKLFWHYNQSIQVNKLDCGSKTRFWQNFQKNKVNLLDSFEIGSNILALQIVGSTNRVHSQLPAPSLPSILEDVDQSFILSS